MKERTNCDEDLGACMFIFILKLLRITILLFITISVVYIIYIIIFH